MLLTMSRKWFSHHYWHSCAPLMDPVFFVVNESHERGTRETEIEREKPSFSTYLLRQSEQIAFAVFSLFWYNWISLVIPRNLARLSSSSYLGEVDCLRRFPRLGSEHTESRQSRCAVKDLSFCRLIDFPLHFSFFSPLSILLSSAINADVRWLMVLSRGLNKSMHTHTHTRAHSH